MESRLEKRIHYCLDLMYGGNDTFSPGMTLNISCHGMRLHAESQMVPIDHEIKLVLTIDDKVISIRGIVCWNSEILGFEPEPDKHLGIFIPDPPPDYVRFIANLN